MYHIVMQAQLAREMGQFSLTDVVAGIEGKLKRRHPHVWGDENVNESADVIRNWEELKASEKEESGEFASILDKFNGFFKWSLILEIFNNSRHSPLFIIPLYSANPITASS